MKHWQDPIKELINEGREIAKTQSLDDIAYFRLNLAGWRGYVSNKWAEFNREYAEMKVAFMNEDSKLSVAKAEVMADATEIALNMRQAKEMLETINQLLNACATIISVLLAEKSQEKHLD